MGKLREDYYGKGAFEEIARFMRGVARMLNNTTIDGVRADVTPFERLELFSPVSRKMPFDVDAIAMGGEPEVPTVTLVAGDFEIHGETAAGTTTTYKTVSPLTVELTGSGAEYVWAEMEWSGSAWGTPVLGAGTSKPNDTATIYRKLLWKFVGGIPSVQYHRGNIEFVGWRQES